MSLLAGCAVGPNYHPPQASPPPQWTSSLTDGETNHPADLAAWWCKFNDTNLDLLVATALQSNLTLRLAQAHVREARAERGVAAGALWPSLGSSAAYSQNLYGANEFPPLADFGVPLHYNLYSAGFDAAWELDLFGGTRRAVEAAQAEIGAAEYNRRDVLVSLLAEVARDYIAARSYQQRLTITRNNIQVQREILDLSSNRFQNGLTSDLDVQQATAILTATEAQVPSLETGFRQNVYALGTLLDQPPDRLLDELAAEKPIPLTPPTVPVGLPSDLLQRRPDIQRAERELAAATARIGVAKADYFPKFSLTGFTALESVSASDWFDYGSRTWSAGPTMQWELFEAGRIRASVRVQNARQEQALDTYQQTVLIALEETESALTAYAKEHVRRQSLSQSVDASQQALELSTQLYKSGLADFLHVLDSERSLYAAQDALVQSDQTVSENLVQLYKSLGGGWETAEANRETQLSSTSKGGL
ncbi:MAG TPA: efflux transporter outer membrane subunit [Candidatus Acidoferrales bacterium]|nr:efflux transporter outer membrane subunit [Candidatus Acidoferrales bacterium]